MNREEWKKVIKEACTDANTYREFFDPVIDSLAGIMETRDNARAKFEASGGQTIVKHTNKGGATNIVKNPALVVIMECDSSALQYWRELGLTPSGFKRINETAINTKRKESALEKALKSLA